MKQPKRYLITSALPYANGPLHIGHLAGAYMNADVYARYQRAKGNDVVFVCGSDEHGAAITIRAKKDGVSPQEVVDKYHHIIKNAFEDFGISFDIYHRTSAELHHQTAQDFFTVLNEKGKFQLKESEQFYDPEANQFLADRYITGTCPKCDNPNAYGDQCEKCGTSLSPTELINPKSTLSDAELELRKTTHWYLPLNEDEEWLREWILTDHANDWKKNVLGQCKSWLEAGLQPRAMTRDLDWGVKVPVKDADGKVLYVWLDAPIGYISATKQWAENTGNEWEPYWKSDDTKLIHFVGKDNIVFHSIIFPSILKAHGDFILPDNVPANEFMNLEGDKISTSRNWAIWLHEYLEDFPNKQDELRYVLLANMPETKDSEFTWADYQARINNELVGNLGNFVNRVMVLTSKYYNGELQPLTESALTNADQQCIAQLKAFNGKIDAYIEQYKYREALATLMDLSRLGNQYLAEREPWKLQKTEPEQAANVLHIALQIAANLCVAMQPFLPHKAEQLKQMLNLEQTNWEAIGSFILQANHNINQAELLFQKVEDDTIEQQLKKLEQSKQQIEPMSETSNLTPYKDNIEFGDFMNIDLRIGTILTAEKVENTDKLLVFTVDMGSEKRTIISGVAQHYDPDLCPGKQVIVVANLAPKKMRGIESQGMILFAEDPEGRLRFVNPEEVMQNGSTVA